MAQATTKDLTTLPVGRLGLIPLISCKDLGEKVNEWLIQWRKERSHEELDSFAFEGYQRESYLIPVQTARFGSGEAKCTIMESVRGDDIYLMVDVCNYSLTYSIGPYENLMSPDDHFQDLKRVIISTNLKLENFSDTYSERTFSRIASNYRMVKLEGKDIRIQKIFLGGK